jgi:SAM-dependent methyltransferase
MDELAARIDRLFRLHGLPDGLPIPPPALIRLVSSTSDLAWFYDSGRRSAESIRRILRAHDLELSRFRAILDFGCGCGRTMRHWQGLEGPTLHGTDYNPRLIAWCRAHLPFARFEVNDLAPPLPGRLRFDLIYALSVFTHLPPDLAAAWLQDLRRRLEPGGYLLVTTHGDAWRKRATSVSLTPGDLEQLAGGGMVTKNAAQRGRNACMTFHSREYLTKTLGAQFEIVDFVPAGIGAYDQDATLLRRR